MSRKLKTVLITISLLALLGLIIFVMRDVNFAILNPKGEVAQKERWLLLFAISLAAIVVVPVFFMTALIAVRYSEKNKNKKVVYKPDWDKNHLAEIIWWGIPILLIGILGTVSWFSTHDLDPYKPLESEKQPIRVQVVALDWKWLFIYPDQQIATVNYMHMPVNTPVNFEITSDAPMNSFWIPQLGGQIYAMSGMSTKLHLIAEHTGTYKGSSANISGKGFAGMRFNAVATSQSDFDAWVEKAKQSPLELSKAQYDKLAKPSENVQPLSYRQPANGLYDTIVHKYDSQPIAAPKGANE